MSIMTDVQEICRLTGTTRVQLAARLGWAYTSLYGYGTGQLKAPQDFKDALAAELLTVRRAELERLERALAWQTRERTLFEDYPEKGIPIETLEGQYIVTTLFYRWLVERHGKERKPWSMKKKPVCTTPYDDLTEYLPLFQKGRDKLPAGLLDFYRAVHNTYWDNAWRRTNEKLRTSVRKEFK